MYVYPRIGPWAHGEVRNGGFPDWLLTKGTKLRSADPLFLGYVNGLYGQVAAQLKGLYFKDGGPVIGVQIENEHGFHSVKDLSYMLALKKMAVDAGIDVPYYTATGWSGIDTKQTDLIPVWGAYPEAPWDGRITDLGPNANYLFSSIRRDPAIGRDQAAKNGTFIGAPQADFTGDPFPYLTVEMGGGHEDTYHRRPIITSPDVVGMALAKLGSGANQMGYYMFHGGSNPVGVLSTLQESRATHYPNDMPIVSYDFQAPISEWGELRPSYRDFKTLHLFLNDFGQSLAPDYAYFPDIRPTSQTDTGPVRWSVRAGVSGGFLFISNYQREVDMPDHPGTQFKLNFDDASLTIPEKPVTIAKGAMMIWPFDQQLSGHHLRYATAQPLCILNKATVPTYVFFAPSGIAPEFVFDDASTTEVSGNHCSITREGGTLHIVPTAAGTGCTFTLHSLGEARVTVLTLTDAQARDAWKTTTNGVDILALSSQDVTFPNDTIHIDSTDEPDMSVALYPNPGNLTFPSKVHARKSIDGIFTRYDWSVPRITISAISSPVNDGTATEPDPALAAKPQPGQQYGATFQSVPGAKVWHITVPPHSLGSLSEAYLRIPYRGDTAAVYLDDKLIADDFYMGSRMTVGLKRFAPPVELHGLTLQVVPLVDERQIYFEPGIRDPLVGRVAADLSAVSVDPVYSTRIGFSR